jgi:hypothetical protein
MHASIVLTVAQSKRLIAKAVAQLPAVKRAMSKGTIAIGRGTTNGYVAEELLGQQLLKGEYVAGRTLPPGMPPEWLGTGQVPDMVLAQGTLRQGATVLDAVAAMGPGDVCLKGGNALDYARGVVGVLVAHPQGGTVGGIYGRCVSQKINLIIPIGLEKLVDGDLMALSRLSRDAEVHPDAPVTSLYPITGQIVTEIEALRLLFGVEARLLAAGGVAGAEGAVWLLLDGPKDHLDRALAFWHLLWNEPNLTATEK